MSQLYRCDAPGCDRTAADDPMAHEQGWVSIDITTLDDAVDTGDLPPFMMLLHACSLAHVAEVTKSELWQTLQKRQQDARALVEGATS